MSIEEKNKMLQLVLSENNLRALFNYNPDEIQTIDDALKCDNVIVVAVAKIINGIDGRSDKSLHKELYNEVFNYLNQNIL